MLDKLSKLSANDGQVATIDPAERRTRLDALVAASEEEGLYRLPPRDGPRSNRSLGGQETAAP
jgi:hypothetical protein